MTPAASRSWLLAAFLTACGSPFSAGIAEQPDSGGGPGDSGVIEEMPEVTDSGNHADATPDEAMPDVRDSGSEQADEETPDVQDSGIVPVGDSGCTPYPPGSIFCGGAPMAVPGFYCMSFMYGGGAQLATPPECQCAGTYTCACILAHSADPCDGAGTFKSCSGTTVYCS